MTIMEPRRLEDLRSFSCRLEVWSFIGEEF